MDRILSSPFEITVFQVVSLLRVFRSSCWKIFLQVFICQGIVSLLPHIILFLILAFSIFFIKNSGLLQTYLCRQFFSNKTQSSTLIRLLPLSSLIMNSRSTSSFLCNILKKSVVSEFSCHVHAFGSVSMQLYLRCT